MLALKDATRKRIDDRDSQAGQNRDEVEVKMTGQDAIREAFDKAKKSGKTMVMVGTALTQEGPIFPVMCSTHGPAHFRTLEEATHNALLHAERFHKKGKGYTIDYTPIAKMMLVNKMNMQRKLKERERLEGL